MDRKKYKVGITVKEKWAANISYEQLDVTLYAVEDGGDGCSYTAVKDNIGITPGTDESVWVKSTQAGQSIYDLAVKYHHFDGTEEEFEAEYQQALADARRATGHVTETDEFIQAAEGLRVQAEEARVSAESARVSAESDRESAEESRSEAESERNEAESERVGNENSRVDAEASRASAEGKRASAENARAIAESFREGAETSRRQQFEGLKTDMETAIGLTDTATARANASANLADEMNSHPMRINTTTYHWEAWDAENDTYVDTGVMATGSPYATFDLDPATGILTMKTDAYYAGPDFTLDPATGNLQITI